MTSNLSRVTTQKSEDLTYVLRFSYQNFLYILKAAMRATRLAHLMLHGFTSRNGSETYRRVPLSI